MSQAVNSTIDERIVEMKFDNKQFESGVKQTMSTLDRLKAALHFDTDTKGIEKIQNTFNNFNLTNAMGAVDAFSQKLSALQIFGKRIVENLADDFYGAIKKVENGIRGVFQQISTGGANRALNIEQAKFQLEGLHIAWEDIKGDIDYAVSGTAYGLDAAARVAAQLSASQVQVGDDMKAALRGISGVAAMTNSSYEEIGRIFSQVAGAGRLYTQDMLQMSSRGLNIAAALGQQLGHTEAEIRDMVTKGQIDFKTFATAMNEAFGEQATKANNTYTGSLSNVKAALSRIGADIKAGHFETLRQVFVDLIPKLNEFKKAFKPVENVIIEVEAAVGKLLQKIISMVDVKKIVEKIAKPIEKLGRKILDVVNVVSEALGEMNRPMEAMKEFAYMSREAAMQLGGFGDSVKYVTDKEEENIEMSDDMSKAFQAAKDIWNTGKYGNGQARIDALTAAGIDPKLTQKIIEEFIQNGYDWDAAVKKVSEDTAKGVDENSERAEKLKKHVQTLAQIFRNMKRAFSAIATSFGNIFKALFKSVTGTMENIGVGDILVTISGKLADLMEKFVVTEEKAEKLVHPIKTLLGIFGSIAKVLIGLIKTLAKVVGWVGEFAYNIIKTVSESKTFHNFITGFSNGIKKIATNFKNLVKTLKKSEGLQKVLNVLRAIRDAFLAIGGAVLLKVIDVAGNVIAKLDVVFHKLGDFFKNLFDKLQIGGANVYDFFHGVLESIKAGTFIKDLVGWFGKIFNKPSANNTGESIFSKIWAWVKDVADKVVNTIKGNAIISKILYTIAHVIKTLLTKLNTWFEGATTEDIVVAVKRIFSLVAIYDLMKFVKIVDQALPDIFKSVTGIIRSVSNAINSVADVNKSVVKLNKAKAFSEIAKVFLALATSLAVTVGAVMVVAKFISKSDSNKQNFDYALKAVAELMGKIMLSIIAIFGVMKLADLAISAYTSKNKIKIPILIQLAGFLFSLAYVLKVLIDSIMKLELLTNGVYERGVQRLNMIFLNIAGFFLVITAATASINRFIGGSDNTSKGLWAISVVLLSMAASINMLMLAVSFMSMFIEGYGTETVEKATKFIKGFIASLMFTMSVLLFAMGFFNANMPDQDLDKIFLSIGTMFIAITAAFLILTLALNDLTISMKLFPTETKTVLGAVLIGLMGLLASIAAVIDVAGKLPEKTGPKLIKNISGIFKAFALMLAVVAFIADHIDSDIELFGIIGILSGLTLIIVALSRLLGMKNLKNLDNKTFDGLIGVFASLALLLVPIALFDWNGVWSPSTATSIGLAMAGLATVVGLMQQVMKQIGKEKPDPDAIKALGLAFAGLAAILVPLIFFDKDGKWNAATATSIGLAMAGLATIVGLMQQVMKQIGTAKPKPKAIRNLALAFASLALILVPLMAYDFSAATAVSIGLAMAGLSTIVGLMAGVMKQIGTSKPDPWAIAALAAAFAGIAVILVPLQMLEGEDWGAYAAAMFGLATVVGAFGFVMKAITSTTTPVQIIMVGVAMLAMSAGLAALGGVLGWVSSKVNIDGLMGLTVALAALATIMTILGAVVGKMPEIGYGILIITAALFAMAIQTTAVTAAIGALMERFPNFTEDLKKFAYTIGELPSQIVKGFKDGFDINSPSKVFEGIGIYCIQGFLIGIKDTLVSGIKAIVKWLQDYIVTPICEFFGIASPSKLFTKIGGFLGEGLINGFGDTVSKKIDGSIILTGIKNKLNGGEFFSIGSVIGDDTGNGILSGITGALGGGDLSSALNLDSIGDKLNLDNLGKGLDINSLINTDSMGELDLTGMSAAITQSTEEGIRGVNYADIFTAEDLIDNEELYNEVKNAGQSGLVAAADEVKRQRAFMGMYPTVQDFLNDIDNNVAPELAKAYHEGNAEVRSTIEAGLIQNYIDQATLSAEAYKYTKQAQIKALKDAEIEVKKERESSSIYGPKTYEQTLDLKVNTLVNGYTGKKVFDNLENVFGNGNILDGSVTFNVNEGQLRSNLTAVSTDISSSVNGLANTLKTELESIKSRIDTFDNNQIGRTNALGSKIGELGNSMNNLDVMLDTGALVGQLIGPIDNRLGEQARRKARG